MMSDYKNSCSVSCILVSDLFLQDIAWYQMAGFFRNSPRFSFGRGLCFVLPAAGCAEGRRGRYGASVEPGWVPWPMLFMAKVTSPSKQPRGWCPFSERPYRGLKTYPDLSIFSCKHLVFHASCCRCNSSTQCCSNLC